MVKNMPIPCNGHETRDQQKRPFGAGIVISVAGVMEMFYPASATPRNTESLQGRTFSHS